MSTCQCSMAISMLGDGCRYCQPQTYIEHLLETLEDARAAPVSEAKAQGVALDGSQLAGLLEQVRLDDDEAKLHRSGAAYWNNAVIACQVAIRDALAAPVQQVSVPGGWRVERGYSPSGYVLHSPSGSMVRVCDSGGGGIETAFALFLKAMLAAAPAAPAADAVSELEGLLLRVQVSLSLDDTEWGYSGAEKYKLLADIRAALAAGKEKQDEHS